MTQYDYESTTRAFLYMAKPSKPSSGIDLPTSATYDLNSGVLLSTTDANSNTTTYGNFTHLLQPQSVVHPDGGSVAASWSATSTGIEQYISGLPPANTQTSQDNYNRLKWVAVQNDSGGYYWNNYCYDGNGNLQYVAYRFAAVNQNNLSCSGVGDTYVYDGLRRITSITHSGANGAQTFLYSGRATKITDENGVSRIIQSDGLGRTTAVCELSSNPQQGVNQVPCGLDISGTGFLTTYFYSTDTVHANAQTVVVTQGSQTRKFQTDLLGRTTLVSEPEVGPTTYVYTYNGGIGMGLTVTRTRPRANQANPTTTTVTTTQYDSIGRVVSVTYSDGTPTKYFGYDAPDAWGIAQNNLKGRLAAHSRNFASGSAATIYGYDAMGRVTMQASCLPSTCFNHTYDRQVAYTWNWAGMLTGEGDGSGSTYTYGRTRAGEITSIVDSYSDATDPANIIVPGSVQNGPNGPTVYGLGNGLSVVNQYDALGRISGSFTCAGSTQPSCVGGTLQAYGFTAQRTGTHVTQSCDTVMGVCNSFGYDEFNRLASRTVNQGTVQNVTYAYDRYGNRWQQNAPQGGPTLNIMFNPGNNIISTAGFVNDAAGNEVNDTFHNYTYDADGNVTAVDGGATASYLYDSLNQRVQVAPTRGTYEFVFDIFGRRASTWLASNHSLVESNAYADSGPIAYRSGGSRTYESQNWLGTERVRTTYNGAISLSIGSLPWADNHTPAGDNGDQHDFAGMERDVETNSEHAQYRQYSTNLGRWLSPDQYHGSYDFTNPQSFNRFSYSLNDPVNYLDPSGLDVTEIGQGCYESTTPYSVSSPGAIGTSGSDYEIVCLGGTPPGCVSFGSQGCIQPPSQVSTAAGNSPSNGPTISNAVCTGAAVAAGASAGALVGEGVGGFLGGLVGAGGGTLVAPGVGTVGGGIAGGSAGAGIGAGVGGFLGGLAGGAASNVLCSKGDGSSFGGNQRENKQANDAKNEAERMTGKKFTRAQERVFHDEITGQNYGYHELVQIAVQVLQGVV